ncbi:MAG TPA: hypothetical protein VFT64_05160 [Rickettsiales bacterium]|nr:hypothetical protein [Rickettsiales bacterium]
MAAEQGDTAASRLKKARPLLFLAVVFAFAGGTKTFYGMETLLIVGAASTVFCILSSYLIRCIFSDKAAVTAMPDGITEKTETNREALSKLIYPIGSAIIVIMLLNRVMDRSTPQIMILPIADKNMHTDKWGDTSYSFNVVVPFSSPLPFYISNQEPFRVNRTIYETIRLNHSQVILRTHAGWLGFPWYELNYRIVN